MKKTIVFVFCMVVCQLSWNLCAQTWTWDSLMVADYQMRLFKNDKEEVYAFSNYKNKIDKYDKNGKHLWGQIYSIGTGIIGLTCDNQNNVYLAGRVYGSMIDNPYGDVVQHSGYDAFIAKISDAGDLIWAREISSKNDDYAYDVCIQNENKLLVTGFTWDTTNFSGTIIPKPTEQDLFVARYDLNGNYENSVFALVTDSIGTSYGLELESDASGDIYLLAAIGGFVQFDTAVFDDYYVGKFFIKMDSDFHVQWLKKSEAGYSIDVDHMKINSSRELIYILHDGTHYDYSAEIKKLSSDGQIASVLAHENFGGISGIDLDGSDAVYFAGMNSIVYSWGGTPPTKFTLHFGKINADGSMGWEYADSACSSRWGLDIAGLGSSAFVCGQYYDSISLFNTHPAIGATYNFFAALAFESTLNADRSDGKPGSGLHVFPNPSNGVLTVSTDKESGSIFIYDVLGNCILTKSIARESEKLDLSEMGKGFYLVEFQTEKDTFKKKIILN